MALHGAPIWSSHLSNTGYKVLRRIQREIAIRTVRANRTASYNAAITLAGMLLFHTAAEVNREIFYMIHSLGSEGTVITISTSSHLRQQALLSAFQRRKQKLEEEHTIQYLTIATVLSHWDNWIKRGASTLSFRITQFLTEYACLGKHHIGAEEHPTCHECRASVNSV